MRIEPLGDRAVLVRLDDATPAAARLRALADAARTLGWVTDAVPGFASLAVHLDTARISPTDAMRLVRERLEGVAGEASASARTVELPVTYDGPDLDDVARLTGLARDEIVALHTAPEYEVRMIGFMPGFPYLAGLDARLHLPRLETPRTRVPAGSVAIGGAQTGVYPVESPGGWRLIGRTAAVLFDARREPAALLALGDRVRFVAA